LIPTTEEMFRAWTDRTLMIPVNTGKIGGIKWMHTRSLTSDEQN